MFRFLAKASISRRDFIGLLRGVLVALGTTRAAAVADAVNTANSDQSSPIPLAEAEFPRIHGRHAKDDYDEGKSPKTSEVIGEFGNQARDQGQVREALQQHDAVRQDEFTRGVRELVLNSTDRPQDELVEDLIGRFLAEAYRIESKYGDPTLEDVLDRAQIMAQKSREIISTTNLALRDAEYNLKARHGMADYTSSIRESYGNVVSTIARPVIAFGGMVALTWYNAEKTWNRLTGNEENSRTDRELPTSSPGGWWWTAVGAIEGISDAGWEPARIQLEPQSEPARLPMPQSDHALDIPETFNDMRVYRP